MGWWHGMAWYELACHEVAWHGMRVHEVAWHEVGWHGMAWHRIGSGCMRWGGDGDWRWEYFGVGFGGIRWCQMVSDGVERCRAGLGEAAVKVSRRGSSASAHRVVPQPVSSK